MDGENNGKPFLRMDDFGVALFLETPILHMYIYIYPGSPNTKLCPLVVGNPSYPSSRRLFFVRSWTSRVYIIKIIYLCLLRICLKLYYNVISKSCINFLCMGLVGIIWALRLSTMDSGSPTVWDARFSGLWRMEGGCEMEAIWMALSREWGNIHGYDGDSFPHSLLSASQ